MWILDKFFKNKSLEFKKNLQKWIFYKSQTFIFQSKPKNLK